MEDRRDGFSIEGDEDYSHVFVSGNLKQLRMYGSVSSVCNESNEKRVRPEPAVVWQD